MEFTSKLGGKSSLIYYFKNKLIKLYFCKGQVTFVDNFFSFFFDELNLNFSYLIVEFIWINQQLVILSPFLKNITAILSL